MGQLAVVAVGLEAILPRRIVVVFEVEEVLWRQDHIDEVWLLLHIFFVEDLAPDGLDASEGVHQTVDFSEALWRVIEVLLGLSLLHRALEDLGVVMVGLHLGGHGWLWLVFGCLSLLIINNYMLAPFKL